MASSFSFVLLLSRWLQLFPVGWLVFLLTITTTITTIIIPFGDNENEVSPATASAEKEQVI